MAFSTGTHHFRRFQIKQPSVGVARLHSSTIVVVYIRMWRRTCLVVSTDPWTMYNKKTKRKRCSSRCRIPRSKNYATDRVIRKRKSIDRFRLKLTAAVFHSCPIRTYVVWSVYDGTRTLSLWTSQHYDYRHNRTTRTKRTRTLRLECIVE